MAWLESIGNPVVRQLTQAGTGAVQGTEKRVLLSGYSYVAQLSNSSSMRSLVYVLQ